MAELITIKTLDRQPFKNMVATIGNLPTSFVDSMSYYEILAWLCNYIEEQIIPTVNTNSEAVIELQGLYVQLKEYVDNYFENLDVQEEINNKLDAMAEAGTLEAIIGAYINANAILAYDTVADMINAENVIDGSFARTYGKTTLNDGLGNDYKILNSEGYTPDGENVISLQNNLVAIKIKKAVSISLLNSTVMLNGGV